MPLILRSLISPTLEVRVLCEGAHSDRVDKVTLGDCAYSPLFSRAVLKDAGPQHLLMPGPPEFSWIIHLFTIGPDSQDAIAALG